MYLSLPPDGNDSNINHTGWYDIGGTSLSCPQWAGLVVIADQINKAKYGQTGLGLINPALYKLATNPASCAADFFDVAHTAIAGVENRKRPRSTTLEFAGDSTPASLHMGIAEARRPERLPSPTVAGWQELQTFTSPAAGAPVVGGRRR